MERFAAMVAGRRAAPTPAPAEEEEVDEKVKAEGERDDEAYLSIQLEEIVVVKNEDVVASPGAAAHGGRAPASPFVEQCAKAAAAPPAGSSGASAVPFMEQCAKAAAAAPAAAGSSTAAAARGAWTTVARMVGFD